VVNFYDINGELIGSVPVDDFANNRNFPVAFSSPDSTGLPHGNPSRGVPDGTRLWFQHR
jgi:hypothetical protein